MMRIALLLLPLSAMLSGCQSVPDRPTCLTVAESGADAAAIRSAAPPPTASGGPELCEGVALMRAVEPDEARDALSRARMALPPDDRWMAEGFLAALLTYEKRDDDALKLWDAAVAGAVKAKDRRLERWFRMDRGMLHGRMGAFAPALEDFDASHRIAVDPVGRGKAAYAVIGVATTTNNLDLARNWYPRLVEAARASGDAALESKGAQFYAQMLDEAGRPDEAAQVYAGTIEAARKSGSKELQAEMLEYQGQSRFTAGDYRGGERAYGDAAQLAREAGQAAFASELEASLRTRLMRYESGSACETFLDAQKPDIAERSVTDVPPSRRSWTLKMCEVRVFIAKGDPGRARQRLEELVTETGSGPRCDILRALAQQVGITIDRAPPPPSAFTPPGMNIDRSLRDPPQPYDGRCRL